MGTEKEREREMLATWGWRVPRDGDKLHAT